MCPPLNAVRMSIYVLGVVVAGPLGWRISEGGVSVCSLYKKPTPFLGGVG
jgi:hypothetical protein